MIPRSVIKGHVVATFQTLHRLRGDMLDASQRGDALALGAVLVKFSDALASEYLWLNGKDENLRAAPILYRYRDLIGRAMAHLAAGARERTIESFKPFGVELVALLSLERDIRAQL